ncbi:P-loop containing nucleoside triphosphate hydrolase protein [Auriscalpium vulgare]|uniref:P-loop containing nucleoside triphosphate hydrolase protein n=1 Tax=Auriscalpium vulgare TaxID=40419 RepID=A0ACB8R5K5_9AGAM|nr:P-loop containing nucleoside triphosphate hydrolase protein [Auriscalpium vulgare]
MYLQVEPTLLPAYATAISALIFLSRLIFAGQPFKHAPEPDTNEDSRTVPAAASSTGSKSPLWRILYAALSLSSIRLFLTTSLIFLSVATCMRRGRDGLPYTIQWIDILEMLPYVYATVLALASFLVTASAGDTVSRHSICVLLTSFAVYVYRDLWPLATYTLQPVDALDGPLLWIKIAVLGVLSTVMPLMISRRYTPYDPKETRVPNPEQTASIFSLLTFSYMDPTVFLARRLPHLTPEDLPPVPDYDLATNLMERSFKQLDTFSGAPKRHFFIGFLMVFRREYTTMAAMLVIKALSNFAGPIGINKLLLYLQDGEGQATIRPWLWILSLFVAPFLGAIAMQQYTYNGCAVLVRTQSIITELVFEHSLRIRMKAEATDGLRKDTAATPQIAGGVRTAPAGKRASNLIGKINNLVSTDLSNITGRGLDFLYFVVWMPLEVTLCVWYLYVLLGWSAFVGMAAMLIFIPIPGKITHYIQGLQAESMKKTDARVQTVVEAMGVLRMIKLFGWEPKISDTVKETRDAELLIIRKRKLLRTLNGTVNHVIPVVTMMVTYVTYTGIMKQILLPSTVFPSMAVFELLRNQLRFIFSVLPDYMQAKVSFDRVTEFLQETELIDEFAPQPSTITDPHRLDEAAIGFTNASFTWSNDNTASRKFVLRIDDELMFKRGCINLIIGPTGSGKTSLLMALLGEMHFVPLGQRSWFNLPRNGGVAYAAQESWVQNETIRDNILFGAPYDESRYEKVIYQCGLNQDLNLFEAGDKTEVGEKGLTLSGGQKARVTLARAIYSQAEILVLDDVLAALDVHTARWIIDKCFKGDLVRGRTILLVTHNVALASPIADFVVSLATDGTIASQGSVLDALAKDQTLQAEIAEEVKHIEQDDKESPEPDKAARPIKGKLIVAEEKALGHIGWQSLKLFFKSLSGSHILLFWFAFLGSTIASEAGMSLQTWWMGHWAEQYDLARDPSQVNITFYLAIYCSILLVSVAMYTVGSAVYVFGTVRSSRALHYRLIQAVLGTTLRWLDTTPVSRVIARCTQDINALDGAIANNFQTVVSQSTEMLVKLGAVVLITPAALLPGALVLLLGGACGQVYMRAQISVKREMSNARAPVLAHFGAAIAGLTSIRAYSAQASLRAESYRRIDRYTRVAHTFYNLNRWVNLRIQTLGSAFSAGLAAWLVYGSNRGESLPSNTGFSITMAIGFSGMILWWVRNFNAFEISANSLERIQAYIDIEQEPRPTREGEPPAYWPASGDLRVEGLSARYSENGPEILHELSFHIRPGERVGVVGRTGSGKSSLTLALLRAIPTEGSVFYDGLPTSGLNLAALRASITVIPQMPELLAGTLRTNLDPFSQFDDATLNSASRAAGLPSHLGLDSGVAASGANLSVGQRQLVALARALVRRSKLLVLDEATSAIDHDTDAVVQRALRRELGADVTVLAVAHRLQTVMDADKIMVLDAGRIVEFDRPSELLKRDGGRLRALVDESGDRDALYAMASGIERSE